MSNYPSSWRRLAWDIVIVAFAAVAVPIWMAGEVLAGRWPL